MTLDQQKEQFSYAYVRAVAAVAQIAVTTPTVDDDSVDLIFHQRGGAGNIRSPRLEAQVKCTAAATLTATSVVYPLKLKNYDDLRPTNILVPRILITVVVPDDLTAWLNHSEQELALRNCGYWLSLRGEPATTNAAKVTVYLPRASQFTVAELTGIMQRIGNGQNP